MTATFPVRSLDPAALVRWLAVTADLLDLPVAVSDKLIAQAKRDAANPTGTINVIVVDA